ncbi:GntR family transcriptional regulator [Sphingomonas koreensis]|nr:GntR family transcriptional regulator [Sphingomonas koreensis]RSY40494.1 GntR family transcriptional regulator [Sphingomonas koreensis]
MIHSCWLREQDMSISGRETPFSRVYSSMRAQLRQARLLPGSQLFVGEWADTHGVSATPVREALAKLAGQGLVEDRERIGYFVPLLSSVELMSLVELLELYLIRAIDHGRHSRDRTEIEEVGAQEGDEAMVLMAVASRSNNPLLVEEIQRSLDRSACARLRQAELFGPSAELASIAETLVLREWGRLSRLVRSHCRVSRSRAGMIAHSMASTYRETIVRK